MIARSVDALTVPALSESFCTMMSTAGCPAGVDVLSVAPSEKVIIAPKADNGAPSDGETASVDEGGDENVTSAEAVATGAATATVTAPTPSPTPFPTSAFHYSYLQEMDGAPVKITLTLDHAVVVGSDAAREAYDDVSYRAKLADMYSKELGVAQQAVSVEEATPSVGATGVPTTVTSVTQVGGFGSGPMDTAWLEAAMDSMGARPVGVGGDGGGGEEGGGEMIDEEMNESGGDENGGDESVEGASSVTYPDEGSGEEEAATGGSALAEASMGEAVGSFLEGGAATVEVMPDFDDDYLSSDPALDLYNGALQQSQVPIGVRGSESGSAGGGWGWLRRSGDGGGWVVVGAVGAGVSVMAAAMVMAVMHRRRQLIQVGRATSHSTVGAAGGQGAEQGVGTQEMVNAMHINLVPSSGIMGMQTDL
jgi:hypothetical protein